MALERFVQAGRKVIIRLRCQARLEKLKKLISDLKAGKSLQKPLGMHKLLLLMMLVLYYIN